MNSFARIFAVIFGIIFIGIGILGFLPSFTTDNMLFDIFEVNSMHNIVHIITGVIAIMAATRLSYTKLFFQIFGVIYAIVAIVGFWRSGDIFGIMQVNLADNLLHLVVAAISLYVGFAIKKVKPIA